MNRLIRACGILLPVLLICAACSSQTARQNGLRVISAHPEAMAFSVSGSPAPGAIQMAPSAGRSAPSMPMVSVDDKLSPEDCLACHGEFKDIAAKSEGYTNEFGEKVNPHRYVPHDSTKLPDCLACHKQHEIPPKGKVVQTGMTMDYCYSCHHTETFAKCTDCHQE